MNAEIAVPPGSVFGRWTVLGRVSASRLSCRCACGTERVVESFRLRSGRSQSCGCLAAERSAARERTHGATKSPEWNSWQAMKSRCYRIGDKHFADYGGRGIKVCDRWLDGFENFLADMGQRPHGATLDRKDNSGDYTPENCRWATGTEQQNNRRSNRLLDLDGLSLTLAEWARRSGLKSGTLAARLRRGWSLRNSLQSSKGAP